ncbi:MAG: InlB B-repeat-containing protein [Anaeroplasmataceae bacterium]|nr:InlB B-repeat-containing protein [Anaeroplasmataceae bacterium]
MGLFTSILALGLCFSPNVDAQKEHKINNQQIKVDYILKEQEKNISNYTNNIVIVTFDFNGGSYDGNRIAKSVPVEIGTPISSLDKSKLKKDNCTFKGWYTYEGELWHFDDIIMDNMTLYAYWNWDCSHLINYSDDNGLWYENNYTTEGNINNYLKTKYHSSTNWNMTINNSTLYQPVEMQGEMFPKSNILTAIETSGVASSYGGCGPIAMMGIMDFYARYYDYSSIMKDPTNEKNRIQLAYDILKNTKTIEISNPFSKNQKLAFYSGGDKSTMTLPGDYINGFTKVMEMYGLDRQITAKNFMYSSKNTLIKKVIESIDKGIPVTLYTGVGCGDGGVSEHYINVYGYEIHKGIDQFDQNITQVIFSARINLGYSSERVIWMDADVLSHVLSGVITYEVKNANHLIKPEDFARDFVNNNGQGQYFFYEKQAEITTSKGVIFQTNRLRCGYIEDKYLVLSAYRENAGAAFLEMNFDFSITALTFELGLWED